MPFSTLQPQNAAAESWLNDVTQVMSSDDDNSVDDNDNDISNDYSNGKKC